MLPTPSGEKVKVCKQLFLSTLGAKSDSIINEFVKRKGKDNTNVIFPEPVGKGRHSRKTIADKITDHIESYRPYVSHYRLKHSPNRRYLDSELTVTECTRISSLSILTLRILVATKHTD